MMTYKIHSDGLVRIEFPGNWIWHTNVDNPHLKLDIKHILIDLGLVNKV